MDRREMLALGGAAVTSHLTGCASWRRGNDRTVSVTVQAAQPNGPVEYEATVATATATTDHPARIRVALRNPTDEPVVLGEERAVEFHHVASTDSALYLYPAGDEAWGGPVEPGCWRLTEAVAVPEYYGTLRLDDDETYRAESYVYGHPDLPEGVCLPGGDHRIRTTGVGGDEGSVLGGEGTRFEWGFTLRIS